MNLKTSLPLLALACIGATAHATNVTDWGTLGPVADVAIVNYSAPAGAIDDVYNFSIGATSDVDGYAAEFEARSVSMPNAEFTLFSGTYGDAGTAQIGAPMDFNNSGTETMYESLATGSYYFEITSSATTTASSYDFEAYANESGGPSGPPAVPEPANIALMAAGIAMLGFIGRRRSNR